MQKTDAPPANGVRAQSNALLATRAIMVRLLLLCACLAGVDSAAGCTEERAGQLPDASASDFCRVRLIVGVAREANDELVADLSRIAGARLEVVRAVMPDLYVLDLSVAGSDAECAAAVERLRSEPGVRSVDVDTRRRPHVP